MYDEIVTQIVMVLEETYLLNVSLCYNILVLICFIQHWVSARDPKVALP